MKQFVYCDLDGDHYITEAQIIEQYFLYWSTMMERVGKQNLISYERCVEDFCTIHWAMEVSKSKLASAI